MHEVEKEDQNRLRHNETTTSSNEIKMYITRNSHLIKKVYNEARCNEVAIVFVDEEGQSPEDRDICIYSKYIKPTSILILVNMQIL